MFPRNEFHVFVPICLNASRYRSGGKSSTLHGEVTKTEVDSGKRAGLPSDGAGKIKALERMNRELRQANGILRKTSACFAMAELDCPFKQ